MKAFAMRRLFNVAISSIALSVLFPLCAFAGTQAGTVNILIIRSNDGLIYFFLNGVAAINKPACATQPYWMIRDENSNAGKQQLAILLSVKVTGKPITVYGRNTCLRWGDGEDVDAIMFQ